MKIAFTYNIKNPLLKNTDIHAEFETDETIKAISRVLESFGKVTGINCDNDLPGKLISAAPDVVFNIAEGTGGRDREGFVPSLCSILGIPCSGSDSVVQGITLDKGLTKRIARDSGVRTSDFEIFSEKPEKPPYWGFPSFVKPCWDGSSRGIYANSKVCDFQSLKNKITEINDSYNQPAIVEPYLPGREFCVALIGNDPPKVLKTCEIILGHKEDIPFFSYEYKRHDTDELDMNPLVNDETIYEMERMSLKLWDVLGCRDYVRIDFRTDSNGCPYFLEINALPGLSPVSGIFVKQAEASGFSFDEIISAVFERAGKKALSK